MAFRKTFYASLTEAVSIFDQFIILIVFLCLSITAFHIFIIAVKRFSGMVMGKWPLNPMGGPCLSVECLRPSNISHGGGGEWFGGLD